MKSTSCDLFILNTPIVFAMGVLCMDLGRVLVETSKLFYVLNGQMYAVEHMCCGGAPAWLFA